MTVAVPDVDLHNLHHLWHFSKDQEPDLEKEISTFSLGIREAPLSAWP